VQARPCLVHLTVGSRTDVVGAVIARVVGALGAVRELEGRVACSRVARVVRRVDRSVTSEGVGRRANVVACHGRAAVNARNSRATKYAFHSARTPVHKHQSKRGRRRPGTEARHTHTTGVVDLQAPQLGRLLSLSKGSVLRVNHTIGGQLVVGACAPANPFVTTPLHHAEHTTTSRAAHRWRQSRRSQRCDRTSSTSTQCCPRARKRRPKGPEVRSGGHRGRTPAANSRQRFRVRSESICTCSKVSPSSTRPPSHHLCLFNFYAVYTVYPLRTLLRPTGTKAPGEA